MLQKTSEEIVNLTNELEQLYLLRDVTFPRVFEEDETGHVHLSSYSSNCGTYRCLLGWHQVIHHPELISPLQNYEENWLEYEIKYFEESSYDDDNGNMLFGGLEEGDLEYRFKKLNEYYIPKVEKMLEEAMS